VLKDVSSRLAGCDGGRGGGDVASRAGQEAEAMLDAAAGKWGEVEAEARRRLEVEVATLRQEIGRLQAERDVAEDTHMQQQVCLCCSRLPCSCLVSVFGDVFICLHRVCRITICTIKTLEHFQKKLEPKNTETFPKKTLRHFQKNTETKKIESKKH